MAPGGQGNVPHNSWMGALAFELEEEETKPEQRQEEEWHFLLWQSFGTSGGRDAEVFVLRGEEDFAKMKRIALERKYTAFVLKNGAAHFKTGTEAEICANMFLDTESMLFMPSQTPVAAWFTRTKGDVSRSEKTNISGIWRLTDVGTEQTCTLHVYHAPGEHRFYGRGLAPDDKDIDRNWITGGVLSSANFMEFWIHGHKLRYRGKVLDEDSRYMSGIISGSGIDASVQGAYYGIRVSEGPEEQAFTTSVLHGKATWQAMMAPPRELSSPLLPPGHVTVVRTCQMSNEYFSLLPPLPLQETMAEDSEPAVVIEPSARRFQTFLGFGGSFTESAAEVLLQMSADQQERIVAACFHPQKGLGYRLGRMHINSCDFSQGNWSCCDMVGDHDLHSFSTSRYQKAIFPFIRHAERAAGQPLGLMASPWSPPGWMKDNGQMLLGGKLKPELRPTWAKFYVRFAQAMLDLGLPLSYLTVQNEPAATQNWESCRYSSAEERDFVRDHLGPALRGSGLDLKLLVWDHNRDGMFARARDIYADWGAAQYVWGTAFHWYGDPRHEDWPSKAGQVCFDNVDRVHELCPDKHLIMTEACQEKGPKMGEWIVGERYAANIIRDLNNWTEGWIDWNLLVDDRGGPNHKENFCSAPIIVSPAHNVVTFQPSYYYIGHFSRYISVGAQRVLCSSCLDSLQVTAFANPDGSIVAVVLNQSDHHLTYRLQIGAEAAAASSPAHSITTFIFHGAGRAV